MGAYEHTRFEWPAGSGLIVIIESDDDPVNPRQEYDQLGTMVMLPSRDLGNPDAKHVNGRYTEPDNGLPYFEYCTDRKDYPGDYADKDEIMRWEIAQHRRLGSVVVPFVYAYYGSGQSRIYACDDTYSRANGYLYATKECIKAWFGHKIVTAKDRAMAEKHLRGEIEEYNQYIQGDVWYVKVDQNDEDEWLEALGNIYGTDEAEAEGKELAEYIHQRQVKDRAEKLAGHQTIQNTTEQFWNAA
jgi:hypothetical protein